MRRLLLAAVVSAGLATPVAAARAEPHPPTESFDYLYVEANEGGSSGGHAAIRFGGETYHFQNRDGLLVLDRERTHDFLHDYALVNNRTIEASRVAVDPVEAATLRAAFDRRYHVQRRQLDVARALEEDEALLEAWSRNEDLPVPSVGYFTLVSPSTTSAASPATADLRARIEQRYGEGFLDERLREARARLRAIAVADPAAWPAEPVRAPGAHPPFAVPWARSYREVAASVAAVEVLRADAGLDPAARVAPAGPAFWLDGEEIAVLRDARDGFEDALVRLAGSPRADWGRPFLVGLARLLALDASLETRRLVVLDVLPDDAPRLPGSVLESRPEAVASMLRFGAAEIEALRAERLETGVGDEHLQTRLEAVVNRVVELERAARARRDLRLAHGAVLPLRAGPLPTALPRRSADDAGALEADLARIARRQDRYREGLEAAYRYHLVTRNCVSELFHTLDDAMGGSAERSRRVLGGHIDGDRDFTFIPFVSAHAVDDRYRVVSRKVIPSYRETRLAEMRERESAWWVALRESNTLTARSYRRGHGDSAFLFFTDDQPLLRPVLGAFNLATATLESVAGLLWAPVDRGDTLVSGLEGMLVSLPELAFWNIRKGSNDWVTPRAQSLD